MRKNLVSVCICTFKRPQMLAILLNELLNQETGDLFYYEVVVVDNDLAQSAHSIVVDAQAGKKVEINYYCEPEQNIALARNTAVKSANGEFIAFIDDDELPTPKWLFHLYSSIQKYHVEGVLGPVKPHFVESPPEWVIKSKICERDSFSTGTVLTNPRYTRTGNVLLSKMLFEDKENFFNPDFGRTGGEDVDFFKRLIQKKFKFIWNNEAVVSELVPPDRTKRKYFLTRALLRGVINSKKSSIPSFVKSTIAAILYTASLPFLFLAGQHVFMKYLIKDCDHIGKVLGICGFKIVKERNF